MPPQPALESDALRTRACPACGSWDAVTSLKSSDFMLGLDGEFHVSRCRGCGLLFQNPALRPELLGRHYPDTYEPYSQDVPTLGRSVVWHLKHREGYSHLDAPASMGRLRKLWGARSSRLQLLPRFVPDGRLLEIACASGNRLALLRSLGWKDCAGIEYSASAAAAARARGFTVHSGRVEDAVDSIADGSLDVVIAGFVLEHLEDPFELVRRLGAKMKPGGQFLFSTLCVDSLDFRMYGRYWYDLDLPRHFTFFRKRDIRRMLAGRFILEEISHQAAPQDFLGSARYRMKHERRLVDLAVQRLGNRLMPACLALSALGLTTRICVDARKA